MTRPSRWSHSCCQHVAASPSSEAVNSTSPSLSVSLAAFTVMAFQRWICTASGYQTERQNSLLSHSAAPSAGFQDGFRKTPENGAGFSASGSAIGACSAGSVIAMTIRRRSYATCGPARPIPPSASSVASMHRA